MSSRATMQQYVNVERQIRELCDNSGLPSSTLTKAEISTTQTHIRVNLVANRFAWVLRFRHTERGNLIHDPTLSTIHLLEDSGKLVKVKVVDGTNGKELPFGYN